MSQIDARKQEQFYGKFKVLICSDKDNYEKVSILESILKEKGFRAYVVIDNSHSNFISSELKDMIRSSICFIAILTSKLLASGLFNQEIGYAQGKGLHIILFVDSKLKNDGIHDIPTKLTVVEFNEDNFIQQCLSVAEKVSKVAEILDEPIDFESFLDFYTKSKTKQT